MELAKVKSQGQTEMLGKIIDQAEIDVWLGGNDLFVEGEENCFTRLYCMSSDCLRHKLLVVFGSCTCAGRLLRDYARKTGKFHWDLGTKEPFEYTNWYGSEPNNMRKWNNFFKASFNEGN